MRCSLYQAKRIELCMKSILAIAAVLVLLYAIRVIFFPNWMITSLTVFGRRVWP